MRLLPLLSLGQACFTPRNYILIDSRFRGGENGMYPYLFILEIHLLLPRDNESYNISENSSLLKDVS